MYRQSQKYIKSSQWLNYLFHKFCVGRSPPSSDNWGYKTLLWKRAIKICSIFNNSSMHCSILLKFDPLTLNVLYIGCHEIRHCIPYFCENRTICGSVIVKIMRGVLRVGHNMPQSKRRTITGSPCECFHFPTHCSVLKPESASEATVVENRDQIYHFSTSCEI